MKTLHLLWLLVLAPVGASAQGLINFATIGVGVNAPLTNMLTGQRVPAGNTFLAQLFYGPAGITDQRSLISVTNSAVGFATAGFINAGIRYTDPAVVAGGQVGTFQVRAWEATLGANWELAYANWLLSPNPGVMVWSTLIQVQTTVPPTGPASLVGISFAVPEPATALLGLLGAGGLLWCKQRRR